MQTSFNIRQIQILLWRSSTEDNGGVIQLKFNVDSSQFSNSVDVAKLINYESKLIQL